jgi:hypothetical protein
MEILRLRLSLRRSQPLIRSGRCFCGRLLLSQDLPRLRHYGRRDLANRDRRSSGCLLWSGGLLPFASRTEPAVSLARLGGIEAGHC